MRIRILDNMTFTPVPLFFLALLGWSAPARGEDWSPQNVEAVFRNKCNHCHTVPDPGSAFDRAWLDQIKRTA